MKARIIIASVVCCLTLQSHAQESWKLIWNDEFDYNGAPDNSKWSFDTEGNNWNWGNDEQQNYTPEEMKNAWVENGNLIIEARKESYRWYGDEETKNYTSARLRTYRKADWCYCKIEVRALLPQGKGMWPAIWLLPTDEVYGGWPQSGELDIMENVGFDPNRIHCNIHTEAYNHKNGTNKGNSVNVSLPYENWHVYRIEWDAESVNYYVDDTHVFTFQNEHRTWKEWPFDQKFHLLLNIAVGGSWGGEQGIDDWKLPQRMLVDYVRVYEKSGMSTMDDEKANIVSVYPTLAEETIYVSGLSSSKKIQIISTQGIVVMEAFADADNYVLNVDGLMQGKYFVKIGNDSYSFIKK